MNQGNSERLNENLAAETQPVVTSAPPLVPQPVPPQVSGAVPPPVPKVGPQVISYATPVQLTNMAGCWRMGNEVIVTHDYLKVPHVCFKCGRQPVMVKRKKVYWQEAWMTFLIGSLVSLLTRKSGIVHVPLCGFHRKKMLWCWVCGLISLVFVFVFFGMGFQLLGRTSTQGNGLMMILGAVVCLVLVSVFSSLAGFPAKPTRIDERFITLKGAGKAYLDQLPPV